MAECTSRSFELTEKDIPGAILHEPLESATIPALKWWLLCRGIQVPTSWKKPQVIERVRLAKTEGTKVIDVDGSYIYRKYQSTHDFDDQTLPDVPLTGWEHVDGPDCTHAKEVPKVTHGLLYTYLADSVGKSGRGEAFRSLQRGYTHWSSGRLSKIEINFRHPSFCHVKCNTTPSMKQGVYHVYMLLGRSGEFATICTATCECAAGQSASCTHISALLHALASLNPTTDGLPVGHDDSSDTETPLPVTSFLCQWNAPRTRKESNLPISEAVFHKHVYRRKKNRELKALADFDPRPVSLRGNAKDQLKVFMSNVRGQGIGVSVLFDESCRCWSSSAEQSSTPSLPSKDDLKKRVEEFKKCLELPPQKLREIEQSTRSQSNSSLWFSVRRYRITASFFGLVFHRKATTPPTNLVLQMLGKKIFTSVATNWGKVNEAIALKKYEEFKQSNGHDVCCSQSGFVISEEYPFLGASPDAVVHDAMESNPFGLVEIKCPYSSRHLTPIEAASSNSFFCKIEVDASGAKTLKLKKSHNYFCQVQGQMAITERKWCDFVVYTEKGLSIERICSDPSFWINELVPKLVSFYDNCLGPELVCPVHVLGMPVRNLEDMDT